MPAPPPELKPPAMWGDEQHIRSLFEPLGVDVQFERGAVDFEDESVEGWLAYGEEKLGPMVMARAALEPQGKWDALRADLPRPHLSEPSGIERRPGGGQQVPTRPSAAPKAAICASSCARSAALSAS